LVLTTDIQTRFTFLSVFWFHTDF